MKRPEILIFDEATSHLDTATERAIQRNLKTAFAGKTVILVAHRLSTIKDADYIYVLHQGRVVEKGTHRRLMLQEGRYWSLWRSQTDEGAAAVAAPSPVPPAGEAAPDRPPFPIDRPIVFERPPGSVCISAFSPPFPIDRPIVFAQQHTPSRNGDGHA